MKGDFWQKLWAGLMAALMLGVLGVVYQSSTKVTGEIAALRIEIERRFGEVNERLTRIETIIEERFDPDPSEVVGNGNGP